MPLRCSKCRNGGQAKKANSWKSASNICFLGLFPNVGVNPVFPPPFPLHTSTPVTVPPTQTTVAVQHPSTIVDATTHVSVTTENILLPSTTFCTLRGFTQETCQMKCNWDGSCDETSHTTACDCNQQEHTSIRKTMYQVFDIVNIVIWSQSSLHFLILLCSRITIIYLF